MNDLQHARIADLCAELRLSAMADLYGPAAQAAASRDASYSDFLEEVLRAERDARRQRARDLFARTAGFPAIKTLDSYDFGFATGAPRQQIQEHTDCGAVHPLGTGLANSEAALQTALREQIQVDFRMKLATLSYRLVMLVSWRAPQPDAVATWLEGQGQARVYCRSCRCTTMLSGSPRAMPRELWIG